MSHQYEVIQPAEFTPSRGGREYNPWPARAGLLAVLLVLAAAVFGSWLLFVGRSVAIEVSPVPDSLNIEGPGPRLKFSDRWLLRPGRYALSARASGYAPLDETLEVDAADEQRFAFEMTKLPGVLELEGPEGARVFIDGELVGTLPLASYRLPEGRYQLEVRQERYQAYRSEIAIEGGEVVQSLRVQLAPDWADVTVRSVPAGATLYVGEEPYGETPLVAQIPAGRRDLRLQLDGYKAWTGELIVDAGQTRELATVRLEEADRPVFLSSTPSAARVVIDGEFYGQTPLEAALPAGQRYRVVFSKPGYGTVERNLSVDASREQQLSVSLAPILGTVIVRGAPDQAQVYVDGRRAGGIGVPIELPAHPHRLEVRAPGYQSYQTTVTPNAELAQEIEVRLLSEADIAAQAMPESYQVAGMRLQLFRPSGTITLGSPRREQGRRANEVMHQASLSRPFYIARTEVSNAQFAAFSAGHDSGVVERATLSLPDQPVVRVSWDAAARFCNALSDREGLPRAYAERDGRMVAVEPMTTGYRLPTEAEWVYLARYGADAEAPALRYPWGDRMPPPPGVANYAGTEAADIVTDSLRNYTDGDAVTALVEAYPADPLGLHALSGNVHEWMHDIYAAVPLNRGAVLNDPMGPASGEGHAVRGASWRSGSITELRLAWRDHGAEGADDIGFRVARYAQ